MSESDTDASTGEPPTRRQSERATQKPNRIMHDLERAASTAVQSEVPRSWKLKSTTKNNSAPEAASATTNTILKIILKKLESQDAELHKLQTLLQTRD